MARVIVERSFPEPVEFSEVQAREDRSAWCMQAHHVRFVRSYFSLDRRRMICVYDAPDAEAVRRANETAGLPFDHVWVADVHGPEA